MGNFYKKVTYMKNESKTLFIPLYGKAQMSRSGFFHDETAERIVSAEPDKFRNVDTSKRLAVYMAMRAMQYDSLTEKFLSEHPDSAVVHLGCGLDSRCRRVKAPYRMWYDLDFADVIELRKEYFQENTHYRMISSSAAEEKWLDEIDDMGKPVLILAEGISMYLTEADIRCMMERFNRRFAGALFIFDAYSNSAAKISRFKNPVNAVNAKISFSMDDHSIFEDASEKIRCVLDSDIIREEYISRLSGILKYRFAFMRRFGSGFYRIYGYNINGQTE